MAWPNIDGITKTAQWVKGNLYIERIGGVIPQVCRARWKLPELQGSLNIFGGDADDY